MKISFQFALTTVALIVTPAASADVEIDRVQWGSGEPGRAGLENAIEVSNNTFHVPQYLPGSPTAASIWPRVVEVLCRQAGPTLNCDGYRWKPAMGRGEYLYFTPVVVPTPVTQAPVVVNQPVSPVIATPVEQAAPATAVQSVVAPSPDPTRRAPKRDRR